MKEIANFPLLTREQSLKKKKKKRICKYKHIRS